MRRLFEPDLGKKFPASSVQLLPKILVKADSPAIAIGKRKEDGQRTQGAVSPRDVEPAFSGIHGIVQNSCRNHARDRNRFFQPYSELGRLNTFRRCRDDPELPTGVIEFCADLRRRRVPQPGKISQCGVIQPFLQRITSYIRDDFGRQLTHSPERILERQFVLHDDDDTGKIS